MKEYLGMAAMMSMIASTSGSNTRTSVREIENTPLQRKKIIPKGCSEYTIDGYVVIASNRKNAERKVQKLKNKK